MLRISLGEKDETDFASGCTHSHKNVAATRLAEFNRNYYNHTATVHDLDRLIGEGISPYGDVE